MMAGISSNIPGYIWLTAHKTQLFILSGLLLALALFFRWRSRNAPCPIDPAAAKACARLRRSSGIILWASIFIYIVGGFFAFFAAELLL
ncbi:MAG: hypothetical protein ABJO36_03845 [Litorimonas sp.]